MRTFEELTFKLIPKVNQIIDIMSTNCMPATVFRHLGFRFELNIDHVFKDSTLQWQQTDYNHTTVNKITSDNDTNEKFCEENTK